MNTFEKDKTYITHTYNRYPVCFVKGEGSHLYDDKGKEYIDMGTGIGVDVLGISYEPWIEAAPYPEPCIQPFLHHAPDRPGTGALRKDRHEGRILLQLRR